MARLLKAATVVSVLAFVLLAILGINDYVPRHYMLIPFGMTSMSLALEIFVSRRDLIGKFIDRAGSPRWKGSIAGMWLLGSFVAFMGAYPWIEPLAESQRYLVALGAAMAALTFLPAIWRSSPGYKHTTNDCEVLKQADVLIAYGRKAQAIQILEDVLRTHPARSEVRDKLREIRSQDA